VAVKHFEEQKQFAQDYLVPFLEQHIPDFKKLSVLEVGCAEAGFLDYLLKIGMEGTGIELETHRVKIAREINPLLKVFQGDITDFSLLDQISERFDVVVMRDVIEHISNREVVFKIIRHFLNPGGYFFITFPPRFSPFAGHQQHARSFLKWTPYVHLLPEFFWYTLGRWLGESQNYLKSVMKNYQIGLSIRQFEKLFHKFGFQPVVKGLFLLRPIFKYRYGIPIIRFPNVPILREFLTTGCEYLLKKI